MRKIVKRIAAAASAVVIGGVSCVTTWFSVPAAAAAGFTWLEWMEFQSLLQGIGVGSSNSDFADSVQGWIDGIGGPEIYRSDYDEWMTGYEYYNRLGWDEIIDWFDDTFSGDDASYSDVADVGTDISGGSGFQSDTLGFYPDGCGFRCNVVDFFRYLDTGGGQRYVKTDPNYTGSYTNGTGFDLYRYDTCTDLILSIFLCSDKLVFAHCNPKYMHQTWGNLRFSANDYSSSSSSLYNWGSGIKLDNGTVLYYQSVPILHPGHWQQFFAANGISISQSNKSWSDYFSSIDFDHYMTVSVDKFIGPVFSYAAAQDLYKSTGTAAGIRLDVQTQDGVPDLQAALDGAGVDTVDDLVAGVAAGTVPMSKVLSDAKVTPYVVADTTAGTVVTDLGVSATATGVKAVGLTQDLAVPKDLTNAATYVVNGKTWDPEMSKYKLPLFQYFPFCLPWDIYQVLAAFSADPVAPVFDVPVGKILSGVRSADVSKAASLSAKIDFGDDNWSKVFEVIRILECAGIIVGLCLVAVYLIHGGR